MKGRSRYQRGAMGILIILLIGAAVVLIGGRRHLNETALQTLPFPMAICDGTASHAEAVVTGEVRLHQALLAKGTLSATELQSAVALQLRYAFASAQNDTPGPTTLTPDGPPRSVEILEQKIISYGNTLDVDWTADAQIQPESDYVKRALAQKQLAATDVAVVVSYRARVGLAVCDKTDKSTRQSVFRFPVPHDPYLLYWHITKERRIVQEYGSKHALTFPCAESELADYDHPEYLWYFWQPRRTQPDCTELLPTPRVLGWVSVRITKRLPPSGDFTRFKIGVTTNVAGATLAPLRVVLVFGYVDHQVARPDPALLKKCLAAAIPNPPQTPVMKCAYDEWGAFEYDQFLQRTRTVLTEDSRVVRAHPDVMEVQIGGQLRRSGRRILVTAYLTETDFLGPPQYAPHHVPLLLDALRTADAVVYVGHSGLGANFAVTQLQKSITPAPVSAVLRSSPVRVLGFIGCYTYSYFGQDFRQSAFGLGPRGREALFVYTGNAVEQTAASALHILATVDCIMQSPTGSLRPESCDLTPVGATDKPDFLIYEFVR